MKKGKYKIKTCSFLQRRKQDDIDRVCDPAREFNNKNLKSAYDTCFITCGRCENGPSANPSESPSSADPSSTPSVVPSMSPSSSPTNIRSSSPSISKSPSSLPSSLPSVTPSAAPTELCNDDDDVMFGSNNNLNCKDLRKKEQKREKQCKNDIAKETCTKTCGGCCADDPSFIFTYKQDYDKSCKWLSTQKANKIKKACKDVNVSYACILTCNACYSEII